MSGGAAGAVRAVAGEAKAPPPGSTSPEQSRGGPSTAPASTSPNLASVELSKPSLLNTQLPLLCLPRCLELGRSARGVCSGRPPTGRHHCAHLTDKVREAQKSCLTRLGSREKKKARYSDLGLLPPEVRGQRSDATPHGISGTRAPCLQTEAVETCELEVPVGTLSVMLDIWGRTEFRSTSVSGSRSP